MRKIEWFTLAILVSFLCFAFGAMYGCFKGAIAVEQGTYGCKYYNDSWHCGVKNEHN